jgi:hypothetical protein
MCEILLRIPKNQQVIITIDAQILLQVNKSLKLIRSKHDKIFRTFGWPPLCHFEFLQTRRQATTQLVAGDVSTLSTVSTSAMTHHIDAIPGFLYADDTTEKVDISSWVERTPGAVIVTDVLKWFRTTLL